MVLPCGRGLAFTEQIRDVRSPFRRPNGHRDFRGGVRHPEGGGPKDQSQDFNPDEAIWGWVMEKASGNLCLGTRGGSAGEGRGLPGGSG